MLKARRQREKEEAQDEKHWLRFRIGWAAFMNAHFKKQGGGKFEGTDLIKLSFDKNQNTQQQKPSLETFERLAKKHGKRKKKK